MRCSRRTPIEQLTMTRLDLILMKPRHVLTPCTDVNSQPGKLSREVESQNEEQSTYLAYDKRVKQLAEELTQSQASQIID